MAGLIIRLLLIGAAVWLAVMLLRRWQRRLGGESPPPGASDYQPMVRCRRCGVHLPAEAVSPQGFCGKCQH